MLDVAVIGAGVVGALTLRELSRYNLSVAAVDMAHDVAMGTTRANSAIVHAGFDAKEGSLKARFNVEGSRMMEALTTELGVKYKRNGSLVVGFTDEDRDTLLSLIERGRKNGVEGLELLCGEALRQREPRLGEDVKYALYAPSGAIVCPYELTVAAVGNAMDNGARLILDFEVERIEKIEGGYRLISGERSVEARYIVNAAGLYSDRIAAFVGDNSFTVTPRRGEYMLLDREVGSLVSHTIFRCPSRMGKGVLVSPTVDGNLILGPTAEDIEDKSDLSTTQEGLALIRDRAGEQVSGIDFSKVITSFTGLRAVGSTGDFIITESCEGFISLGGIESPGLSAAPAIAVHVVEMLKDRGLTLDKKADFNPTREAMHLFSSLDKDGKNAIIAEHPEYAHIICRCETVSEGEILKAIRTNPRPRDVDGVKRRTRATMGRCQGGFCTPYIVELLAREMGVAYTEVTKSGGASYINIGLTGEGYDD